MSQGAFSRPFLDLDGLVHPLSCHFAYQPAESAASLILSHPRPHLSQAKVIHARLGALVGDKAKGGATSAPLTALNPVRAAVITISNASLYTRDPVWITRQSLPPYERCFQLRATLSMVSNVISPSPAAFIRETSFEMNRSIIPTMCARPALSGCQIILQYWHTYQRLASQSMGPGLAL